MKNILSIVTLFVLLMVPVFATTIHIPDDYPTIQTGIDAASDGDTVFVSAGTYVENINFNGKNIVVQGEDGETTIIDGNQSGSVVTFDSIVGSTAVLSNFTITGGNAYDGGGIYCTSSAPTIKDNIITGNVSETYGGGISCNYSSAVIMDNMITFNSGYYGGGISFDRYTSSVIKGNNINGNYAVQGGGISCTVFSSPSIINNTISGNSALTNGGGVYCVNVSSPTVTNTIIWDNIASTDSNISIYSADPIFNYCDIQGNWEGIGNIDSDPLFVAPESGNFHIQANSPCIDAGDPDSSYDPDGTVADMGAYYYHQESPGEPPDTLWTRTFGWGSSDYGRSVQQTTDGGYIITGHTSSFGHGDSDAWLIKTDPNGNEEWNQNFGGYYSEHGNSVQQTNDGGYIITGNTSSFGNGDYDVWLIKTDSEGNEVWIQTFGGGGDDYGYSVKQTEDGGYIIAGHTNSFGNGDNDVWLIKTDSDGNEEWNQTFNFSNFDIGYSVQQTFDGGYIVTGFTNTNSGGEDILLIKTNTQGIEEWNQTFNFSNYDEGYSVQQTTDGGYIITGYTESYENENNDVLLIKTDSEGNEVWIQTFGGGGDDYGYSVKQTEDGGYIIAGHTNSFGNGDNDVWLIKTDSDGNEEWNQTFGGWGADGGESVQQTTDGGYIVTGWTQSYGSGGFDVWLLRLEGDGEEPPPSGINVDYQTGWNLVGLPLDVEDAAYYILFPGSIEGTLYSFNDGYNLETNLMNGEGYWLRFNESGSTTISGTPIYELTISLNEGWNLISGLSEDISIYSVSDPDSSIIPGTLYGFNEGYLETDILVPGKGYWLRAFQDGEVSLIVGEDPPAGVSYSTEIQPIFNNNCISCHINGGGYFGGLDLSTYENLMSGNSNNGPVVTVGDGANSYIIQKLQGTASGSQMPDGASPLPSDQINLIAQWIDEGAMNNRDNLSKVRINQIQRANTLNINGLKLFFGLELSEKERLSYSLPPKPPVGAFDVRFKDGWRAVKDYGVVEVMPTSETLTIAYNIILNVAEHYNWVLTATSDEEYIMEATGELVIPSVERFTLERKTVVPESFTLHQNFPNPFNPITTLRYDLPSDALVTLSIYDMLGREITQLVNTTQQAGFKSVQWDATDSMGRPVSAGVYLYQIEAGDPSPNSGHGFVQTRKMVLLK